MSVRASASNLGARPGTAIPWQRVRARSAQIAESEALTFYGAVAIAALVLVVLVMRLWQASPFVPFTYGSAGRDPSLPIGSDDAIYYLAQAKTTLEHGWYFRNELLGAPFGFQTYDYPDADNLNLLLVKLLATITGSYVAGVNLFFLATFVLDAWAAGFVLRRFGVRSVIAGVVALLYAFAPYHFFRGTTHLFLSAYYTAPLAIYLAMRLWTEPHPFHLPVDRRGAGERIQLRSRSSLPLLGICVLIGSNGLYYPAYAVILIGCAAMVRAAQIKSRVPLAAGGMLVGTIVAVTIVNHAPSLAYVAVNGWNEGGVRRQGSDAETYGLKVIQLVLPISGHRLPAVWDVAERYAAGHYPAQNENQAAALGVVGTAGFLWLLASLVVERRRWNPGPVSSLAVLNACALLFATVGGFGSLVTLLFGTPLRSHNRISIFIAFLALMAIALVWEGAAARYATTVRRNVGLCALALLLLGLGVYDQTSERFAPSYQEIAREVESDSAFVAAVERVNGGAGPIFQLPHRDYPEETALFQMRDYDHFRGYLYSNTLSWSYGAMRGRQPAWQRALSEEPADRLVAKAAILGFDGIYVDRFGYADRAVALEEQLVKVLDAQPLVSGNQRLAYFSIRDVRLMVRNQYRSGAVEAARQRLLVKSDQPEPIVDELVSRLERP